MDNYKAAQKEITKALRAINKAADLLADMPEYENSNLIFHGTIVYKVNQLITTALTLNEVQI